MEPDEKSDEVFKLQRNIIPIIYFDLQVKSALSLFRFYSPNQDRIKNRIELPKSATQNSFFGWFV